MIEMKELIEKYIPEAEVFDAPASELNETLNKTLDQFKKDLNDIIDIDGLEVVLADMVADVLEEVKGVEYPLPEDPGTVFEDIAAFVDGMSVEFAYTLGLAEMYDFWMSEPESVPHTVLDSTLRTLQSLQYKGRGQWGRILAINEYMKPIHAEFKHRNAYNEYIIALHCAVLEHKAVIQGRP